MFGDMEESIGKGREEEARMGKTKGRNGSDAYRLRELGGKATR